MALGVRRCNNRENDYVFRDTLMALLRPEAMPYQELIREKVSESTRRRGEGMCQV